MRNKIRLRQKGRHDRGSGAENDLSDGNETMMSRGGLYQTGETAASAYDFSVVKGLTRCLL